MNKLGFISHESVVALRKSANICKFINCLHIGVDVTLKSDIYYRKTQFSPHLLETFPAVNGISCIVVGTPESTNKSSTE